MRHGDSLKAWKTRFVTLPLSGPGEGNRYIGCCVCRRQRRLCLFDETRQIINTVYLKKIRYLENVKIRFRGERKTSLESRVKRIAYTLPQQIVA